MLAAYVAAAQSLYTTPVLLGAVTDSLDLRADQVGLMTTLELLGFACAGLFLSPRLDRLPRQRIAVIAALGAGAANVLAGAIDTLPVLTGARVLAGLSVGALLATTNAEIAHFADAERRYARCMMVGLLFGCVSIFVIPEAARRFGHAGSYGYIATFILLMVPLMRGWPPPPAAREMERGDIRALWPLFVFVLLLFFSDGLVYPFAERIGRALGLRRSLDVLLAIALGIGLFGAGGAARLGPRFGNLRPMLVGAWGDRDRRARGDDRNRARLLRAGRLRQERHHLLPLPLHARGGGEARSVRPRGRGGHRRRAARRGDRAVCGRPARRALRVRGAGVVGRRARGGRDALRGASDQTSSVSISASYSTSSLPLRTRSTRSGLAMKGRPMAIRSALPFAMASEAALGV